MAFGKPDILDPKFELRPIQAAISAARQRIVVLEAAVAVLQNTGTRATDLAAINSQLAQLTTLINSLTLQVDGIVVSGTVDTGDMPVFAMARRVSDLEQQIEIMGQAPVWRT